MFCSKCGTQNLDSDRFCKNCGEPLKLIQGSKEKVFQNTINLMDKSNEIIKNLITFFRQKISPEFFLKIEKILERLAAFFTPLGGLLGLVMGSILAIKLGSIVPLMAGVGWVILLCVCYYVGYSFLFRCRTVVENNQTIINGEYLEVCGLFFIIAFIGISIGGTILAIQSNSFEIFKWVVVTSIVLALTIAFYLHPILISTTIEKSSSISEDAIAIGVLFAKSQVRMAGIAFGLGALYGFLNLLYSAINMMIGDSYSMLSGGESLLEAAYFIPVGLAYPFFIYLTFVFFFLFIDLIKAVLSIPTLKK